MSLFSSASWFAPKEPEHQPLPQSEEDLETVSFVDEGDDDIADIVPTAPKHSKKILLLKAAVVLAIVVGTAGVAKVSIYDKRAGGSAATTAPKNEDKSTGEDAGKEVSPEDVLPEFTLELLRDPKSRQSVAWEWIKNNHPDWGTYYMPEWRIHQLMTIVTLMGTGAARALSNFYGYDECDWRSFSDIPNCTYDGQYLNLPLQEMEIKGTIPKELGLMTELVEINLNRNELTGPLPTELGMLTKLQALHIHHNNLTSTLPSQMGELKRLKLLHIEKNELTGQLPTELGTMDGMITLHLQDNNFTSTLPSEIALMSSLSAFSAANAVLTGSFPSEICSMRPLRDLVLNDNELTGTLPEEFPEMRRFALLQLQNNRFSGRLPSGTFSAHTCDLSGNNFARPLPSDFGCHLGKNRHHSYDD